MMGVRFILLVEIMEEGTVRALVSFELSWIGFLRYWEGRNRRGMRTTLYKEKMQ